MALYRGFQILLPSLGTWWMVTRGRGMIPLCAQNIPLCYHIVSKEALVVVLRWIHIRSNCPFLCVVSESDIFPLSGMHAYQPKKHVEGTLLQGLSVKFSI